MIVQGYPTSTVMMPTDKREVVLYSTSVDPIVVSVTVFEIFDIKAIFSIGCKPKSELNRKQIDAHARLLLPVLLAIELTLQSEQ